jgi:acylphosphatase
MHGRVQGVFFRDTVRRRARELRVAGWVRNRADGAVEAVFEGDAEAVEKMVAVCRQGPPQADVREFECFDEQVEGVGGFTIR